jgi:hypothetical protein
MGISKEIFNIISTYNNIVWVELGVYKGENAKYIFENYDIKKMYLIDPYQPLDYLESFFGNKELVENNKNIAKNNLKNFDNKCIWLEDYSENVSHLISDDSVDILYIDGNHSFEPTLSDLRLYYPKVKKNGLIIGDDYNDCVGVNDAINLFAKENNIRYKVSKSIIVDNFWFKK